jgi:hypothetical protein
MLTRQTIFYFVKRKPVGIIVAKCEEGETGFNEFDEILAA